MYAGKDFNRFIKRTLNTAFKKHGLWPHLCRRAKANPTTGISVCVTRREKAEGQNGMKCELAGEVKENLEFLLIC